jgi:hypothetical protein
MSRKPVKTVLGRQVCTDCQNTTIGLAAGVLGAPITGADPLMSAVLTQGIFRRMLRRKKPTSPATVHRHESHV